MPNWITAIYVFRSKEKSIIQDFRDKLLNWTEQPSLMKNAWNNSSYWLGNILLHAGFQFDKETHSFNCCSCRGHIENIEILEETDWRGEHFFYFSVTTETAWREMSKIWLLITEKLYPGKMDFGYISYNEPYSFVHIYKPEILELIGIEPDQRYWIDRYFDDWRDSKYDFIGNLEIGEINSKNVAEIFSDILEREISEEEVNDEEKRKKILDEIKEILTGIDSRSYLNITKMEEVFADSFE